MRAVKDRQATPYETNGGSNQVTSPKSLEN